MTRTPLPSHPQLAPLSPALQEMSECMGAADCVVTKAGPGTIAEALIRGLPLVLSGFVPCQEEGNIPFVVDNHVGAFNTNPAEIAKLVGEWFSREGRPRLAAMAAKARTLGRPAATEAIVRDLVLLAHGGLAKLRTAAAAAADSRAAAATTAVLVPA